MIVTTTPTIEGHSIKGSFLGGAVTDFFPFRREDAPGPGQQYDYDFHKRDGRGY